MSEVEVKVRVRVSVRNAVGGTSISIEDSFLVSECVQRSPSPLFLFFSCALRLSTFVKVVCDDRMMIIGVKRLFLFLNRNRRRRLSKLRSPTSRNISQNGITTKQWSLKQIY